MTNTNRRRLLKATAASSLVFVGGCLSASENDSGEHPVTEDVTDWPSFRGDRYNTGYAKGVSPTSSAPSIDWTSDAEGPFWGSPVVADGSVYIGCADHSLYALDAETGDVQWTFQTDHRIEGSPAYADGTVYVGSYDMHVYALDAESGDERWAREVGGLVRGSPTVWQDTVFVGVGCHNLACAWYADEADVSEDGWVYALDAESGETNWQYAIGDEVVSTPAIDDETVYIGGSDGVLYALDTDSGDVEWSYDTGDMIWSTPAVAFGTVYFADWNGAVHAVSASSGEVDWTTDTFSQYISGSVAVDEEAVYVGNTPYNSLDDPNQHYGELFKLDRTDGEEQWSFETAALEIGSSPVVTDDRLYIGAHGPTEAEGLGVYAISTAGEEEWFLQVGGRGVGSSPALVDGTLYFGGTDELVYAIS